MRTIEIDFDVFKALTIRRESEDVSYNDVLRDVLGLDPAEKPVGPPIQENGGGHPWVSKGVSFPNGTEFRASYKAQEYRGTVEGGQLVVNGTTHTSPSSAAVSITGNPVNGWIFWECKRPGDSGWKTIKNLRKN